MIKTLRTYKIKEKDTINKVAEQHGLDTQELIEYHNQRAESHEQIKNRIPTFLQEIILPPKGYIIKNGKEVWATPNEPEPNILKEPYLGRLSRKFEETDLFYGVLKTIKNGDIENTIKYEKRVKFYPKNEINERYVLIDIVSKVFINDKEPDLVADELALKCTEVLYPLILQTDYNNKLLNIKNHDEILKRWKKHKSKVLNYYSGETAKKYVSLFEETLTNKDVCFHYLKNDWFFQLYFNKVFTTYIKETQQKPEIINFPIVPNTKAVAFETKRKANTFLKTNKIRIDIKGECLDKRNKNELESKIHFPASTYKRKQTVKGMLRILYFLEPATNITESAFLECELELTKKKYVSISISKTSGDTYLKKKEELGKQQSKTKKPFWKSIFS
ncbi:hypothetical protein [uncultured Olleya sp.]|uniref:hypothetical protein n=1 Tax=uncultured Olleya sp. TaxID=757243 RepID=UPI002599EB84|nr:hypothetical protein [uncultured Olleya sp.]